MSNFKQDRVAERIRILLSELLIREISDPSLQGITFTKVELDPELMFAKIYVNALGEEDRKKEVLQGLKRAKGFLRREIGRGVRLRNTPELVFRWDETLEYSERINRLLSSLDIPPDPEASPAENPVNTPEDADPYDDEWDD